MDETLKNERVETLLGYIMKHCLWQFHSRAWDRERQNREILGWAKKSLLGEGDQTPPDRLDRCHWVDGKFLARAWSERHAWLAELDGFEISELVDAVQAKLDHVTITGSLNLELTDHQY
jgi:nitrogenase delta subunit